MSAPASAATAGGRRRHVLDLDDFSTQEIDEILDTAVSMKEVLGRAIKQVPTLRGKTIVNMFFEDSTRTGFRSNLPGKRSPQMS